MLRHLVHRKTIPLKDCIDSESPNRPKSVLNNVSKVLQAFPIVNDEIDIKLHDRSFTRIFRLELLERPDREIYNFRNHRPRKSVHTIDEAFQVNRFGNKNTYSPHKETNMIYLWWRNQT